MRKIVTIIVVIVSLAIIMLTNVVLANETTKTEFYPIDSDSLNESGNQKDSSSKISQDQINSLEKGSWSLQFQFSNYFRLTSFQGLSFSMKRHFTTNHAARFGFSPSFKNTEDESSEYTGSSFNVDYLIKISSDYIYYFNPESKKINLFTGIGPVFEYSYDNSISHNNILKSIETIYSGGINFILGVEWFLNNYISIHSEYGVRVSYEITDREYYRYDENNIPITTTTHKSKNYSFQSNSVNLGLSLYL